jgi:hypothetical protein
VLPVGENSKPVNKLKINLLSNTTDNEELQVLWIGQSVSPQLLLDLLGVDDIFKVDIRIVRVPFFFLQTVKYFSRQLKASTSHFQIKTDGAPCFRHPLLQTGSQYNRTDVQGKGRSHGEASDRATELRRSRDRICRYAHGRSQQRRIGLSRLCVTSRALNILIFTITETIFFRSSRLVSGSQANNHCRESSSLKLLKLELTLCLTRLPLF